MKKNFKYAILNAIAVVGAVSFSACSSSEDVVDNPDYNPETNSVKTTITLSVNPNNANASTRQTEAIAQVGTSPTFRGITNMVLVPSDGAISSTTSTSSKITLEDFTAFDASTSHKLYANKDVAVGVKNFLFLGKAKTDAATSADDVTTKLASGYTTNNFSTAGTVGDININPERIATTSGTWATQSAALVTYLNSIANAAGWEGNADPSLNGMHTKFTRPGITAGSASAVLLTLQDLYRKADERKSVDATTVGNIQNAITTSNAQLKAGTSGSTAELEWTSACTFKDFPTNLGVPEGAAQYKYNATASTPTFEYVIDGTNATQTAVANFVYPNELYYLTNTQIKVSSIKEETWPATVDAWKSSEWTGWTGVVDGNTKNIALKYNIQYGSALLATQVKCAAGTLYDNAKAMSSDHPTTNTAINVGTNPFQLTGVIVGGQPTVVGWNFLPASTEYTYAIYDPMTATNVGTDFTAANYTLVFDNNFETEVKDVNICLEFLNNSGQNFYGKDGLILAGQKFYLVGKLKASERTADNPFTRTTSPVGSDEEEATYFPSRVLRAFIQDFTTTAQFTITAGSSDGTTAGSLTNAMSTIPDLRATQQTIGLSVDMTWRDGLTYTSNLGEN